MRTPLIMKTTHPAMPCFTNAANAMRILIALAFLIGAILPASLQALEPPRSGEIEALRNSGELPARIEAARALGNHRFSPLLVQRFVQKMRAQGYTPLYAPESELPSREERYAPPSEWKGMPTTGVRKIFVLLIEFSDYPHLSPTNDLTAINNKLFGKPTGGTLPYDNLANFYARSSYGKLDLSSGMTLGWYKTGLPRSSVTQTDAGREKLIMTALNSFNPTVNFSQFDNDGDGYIDYFAVVWTGPDSGWAGFWWGYQTDWKMNPSYALDGKKLGSYSWQWESRPVGGAFSPSTIIHETGHALGLPDYYDYNEEVGPDGGVGGLDQMDAYGDHNSFSKWMLDWITPTVIASGSQTKTLNASSTSQDAVMIMPGAASTKLFSEYFMVQNRQRAQNDIQLPSDGLLIWHVDATLNAAGTDFAYDNSYANHKLLRLMEADGLEEIETGNGYADADDFYKSGKTFGATTKPASQGYQNVPTGVTVSNISVPSSAMSATFGFTNVTSYALTVSKSGNGIGLVSSVPSGVSCGSDCAESFIAGTSVTLKAVPESNTTFNGWSGACSGTSTCALTMNAAKNVGAAFTAFAYCASASESASGEWISRVQLNTGDKSSTATKYSDFTNSALTAVTAETSYTVSVTGRTTGSYPEYAKVWIDFNQNLNFGDSGEEFDLGTSTFSGTHVFSNAIAIPADALLGATRMRVALKYGAAPTACGTYEYGETEDYTITIAPKTYLLTVTKTGAGSGTVTSAPTGISCGTDCTQSYNSGTSVVLTATPATGSTFAGWSGACTGMTCTAFMNAAKTATASFATACQAGDMDCNGAFNIFDVQRLVNCILAGASCANGDLNGDGQYNIFDIQKLINKIFNP